MWCLSSTVSKFIIPRLKDFREFGLTTFGNEKIIKKIDKKIASSLKAFEMLKH
jgi:hypothetical protein